MVPDRGRITVRSRPDGDNGAKPVLITVDEILDYVTCPLMYAFKHIYRIEDRRPKPSTTLWADVLSGVFVSMHHSLLFKGHATWSSLLALWESSWSKAAMEADMKVGESRVLFTRGVRHVRVMFDSILPNMAVLGVNYPSHRRYKEFELAGMIPVIRAIETPGKGRSGREIQIISIDSEGIKQPTRHDANRRIDYLLSKYGIEGEMRLSMTKLAARVRSMVFLPRRGHIVTVNVVEKGIKQADVWVSWVLDSIRLGHFYPRTGAHCSSCQFPPVCDARFLSTKSMGSVEQTTERIRRKLWGSSSSEPT